MPKNAFKCLLTRCQLFRLTVGGGAGGVGRCFFGGGVSGGEFSKNEQMFVKIKTEHHTEF